MRSDEDPATTGAKALIILSGLRRPEGPLFHGDADTREFFCKL
jgi:hypothetical protein